MIELAGRKTNMLAFTINDTKSFMNLLLKGTTFDGFSFRQGEVTTFAAFAIEGKRNMAFYSPEETEQGLSRFVRWEEIRPFVFHAVKGSKLPKSIKLVFSLPDEKLENLTNVSAAFLNILFKENHILCTTAIAQESFSLDKSGEKRWEEYVLKFFKKNGIGIQLQEG